MRHNFHPRYTAVTGTDEAPEYDIEGGMVTVETAITMPIIVLVLVVILLAARFGVDHLQACGEARNIARQHSLGEARHSGADLPHRVVHEDGLVSVTVRPRPLNFLGVKLPTPTCTATFVDEGAY